MSKTVIVVLSDPNAGEESVGRLFNALAVASDLDRRGQPVTVEFAGAGTRWPGVVTRPDHPVNALYRSVSHLVGGASCGCADVFGARADVERAGVALLTTNAVPGTSGLVGLADHVLGGDRVLTF